MLSVGTPVVLNFFIIIIIIEHHHLFFGGSLHSFYLNLFVIFNSDKLPRHLHHPTHNAISYTGVCVCVCECDFNFHVSFCSTNGRLLVFVLFIYFVIDEWLYFIVMLANINTSIR